MQLELADGHNPFSPETVPQKDNRSPAGTQMSALSLDLAQTAICEIAYQNSKYSLWPGTAQSLSSVLTLSDCDLTQQFSC